MPLRKGTALLYSTYAIAGVMAVSGAVFFWLTSPSIRLLASTVLIISILCCLGLLPLASKRHPVHGYILLAVLLFVAAGALGRLRLQGRPVTIPISIDELQILDSRSEVRERWVDASVLLHYLEEMQAEDPRPIQQVTIRRDAEE